MNPIEYYQLQAQLTETGYEIFQIWMGFTFATIVAFTLGAKRIKIVLLYFVVLLYVLASGLFAARFWYIGATVTHYNNILAEAGYEMYPTSPAPIFYGMLMLYLLGTLGTAVYGVYEYRSNQGAT